MLDAQTADVASREVLDQGYTVLPNALGAADLARLRSGIEEALKGDLSETREVGGIPTARVVNLLHHASTLGLSDLCEQVADHPTLNEAAHAVFGGRAPVLRNVYAIRSLPTDVGVTGLPYGWHFDRLGMVKGFLALDAIADDNGPTEVATEMRAFCKRRRLLALRKGVDPLELNNALDLPSPNRVPLHAMPGDMVILDTDVPHRASVVKPGHDRLILRVDLWCPDHPGLSAQDSALEALIWATVADVSKSDIPPDARDRATPISDYGIDSLGLVTLLVALETTFGMTFSFAAVDARNFQSVNTIEMMLCSEGLG